MYVRHATHGIDRCFSTNYFFNLYTGVLPSLVQDMLHMEVKRVFLIITVVSLLVSGVCIHLLVHCCTYAVLRHVDCEEHVQSTSKCFGASSENTK
jgi:hypothetical protein